MKLCRAPDCSMKSILNTTDHPKCVFTSNVNRVEKVNNWEERLISLFERTDFGGDIGGFVWALKDSTGEQYELDILVSFISQELTKAREEERERIKRDLDTWCESQAKRWGNSPHYAEDRFIGGVISAYRWMADHLPHLVASTDCKCPRSTVSFDGLTPQKEEKV